MARIYDISVPLRTGGVVYPGNPEIRIAPQQEIAKGGSSNVSSLAFGSHTGTHVDAPHHIYDGRGTVDQIPLDVLMGPTRLVAFGDDVQAVDAAMLKARGIEGVERLLVKTRNSRLLHDATFHPDYSYIAPDAAEYLVAIGVRLVGVDYYSIEQFHSGHHKTHKTLLAAAVVIVEGLDLSEPPEGTYDLRCLPLRIAHGDGAPARAVLVAADGDGRRG